MVDLLALAHDRCCEARLAAEIDVCLDGGGLPDPAVHGERFVAKPEGIPDVGVALPPMSDFDDCLPERSTGMNDPSSWTRPSSTCCSSNCACPPCGPCGGASRNVRNRKASWVAR